nr:MAG TPA: hypothetical protein [Caudoviricetes sp.]
MEREERSETERYFFRTHGNPVQLWPLRLYARQRKDLARGR